MTDVADLQRRYRRLLACYPAAFRREHEQEILSVLVDGAEEGQRWPRLAEAADLLRSAIPEAPRRELAPPARLTRFSLRRPRREQSRTAPVSASRRGRMRHLSPPCL